MTNRKCGESEFRKSKMNKGIINKGNMIKRIVVCLLAGSLILGITACGNGGSGKTASIEGELTDIMSDIYASADLDSETREAMEGYITDTLTADNETAILGVSDVPYIEGVYSMPMISSIAYQCVLLRVEPENVDQVKDILLTNADPNKWICVSAETVLVENIGDLVLFIMGSEDVAYAVSESFKALGEG